MSSGLVLESRTAGRIVLRTSKMGFFSYLIPQVMKVRLLHSQPTSSPQNRQLPNPRVFHITSNVDVAAVAVHATKGTSCPVYIRSLSILQYCSQKLSPPHSSMQWALSMMTAVTCLQKVTFHRL